MRRGEFIPGVALVGILAVAQLVHAAPAGPTIPSNRTWEVLPAADKDAVATLERAARLLGTWKLDVAGQDITGALLQTIVAAARGGEPLPRALRETLRQPIDVEDFLLFLDDVLWAGKRGLRGKQVFVPSGRARNAGILVHPDDVFFDKPRLYGRETKLPIDKPKYPAELDAAADGDPLGPNWAARYRNPSGEEALLAGLAEHSPSPSFAPRVRSLLEQLRAQGADAHLVSTYRRRERGYLMYGAFHLRQSPDRQSLRERVAKMDRLNREWGLNLPIRWRHPQGWAATQEAARGMSDAYDVVFATEAGARASNHYDGVAADLVAVALPRELTLRAPDGETRTFDLSDPAESRDLSVSPALVEWVETHFGFVKLRSDYPHWDDREGMALKEAAARAAKDAASDPGQGAATNASNKEESP